MTTMPQPIKTYLLLFFHLVIIFFANVSHAQNLKSPVSFDIKLTYEVDFLQDSSESQSFRTELTHLLVNDSMSLFESSNAAALDSAQYLVEDDVEKKRLLATSNSGTAITYKVLKKANRITTYDLLFNNRENTSGIGFFYDEAFPEWELSADTTRINGLLCQKASTQLGNREWIAWFTTEIPISDGPYKFCGLPGLVVQVKDRKEHWVFTLRDIQNTADYKATLQGQMDYERLADKETFFAAKREYNKSIFAKEELRSGRKYTPETRAIIEKRLQSFVKQSSNWIELDSAN